MSLEFREELEAIAQESLESERVKSAISKLLKDITCCIQDDLEFRLQSDTAYNLGGFAQRIAENIVNAILAGDEDAFRTALSCKEGRYNGRETSSPVIHCKLFESNAVSLRREIAQAFPDLIANERILDLESQLAAVVEQVNRLEKLNKELAVYYRGPSDVA